MPSRAYWFDSSRGHYLESVQKPTDKSIAEPPALSEEEIEAVLCERMKTFERDKEAAEPWPEIKARILSSRS